MKAVKRLSASERQEQKKRNMVLLIVIVGAIGLLAIVIKSYFTDAISVSDVSVRNSEQGNLVKYTLKNRTDKSQFVTLDIVLYSPALEWKRGTETITGRKRITLSLDAKEVRNIKTIAAATRPPIRASVFVVSCSEEEK